MVKCGMRMIAAKTLIFLGLLFCLSPWDSSALALISGVAIALALGNPWIERTRALPSRLLAYSVVGLGAGMNLEKVAQVGLQGLGYTFVGIATVLLLGIFLGRVFRSDRETSILISVGTAICGGSAIAAVAPVIRARSQAITVALATVFLLNSVALLSFPYLGHALSLSESQFGLWIALAIHDTSSVVGAGLQYGSEALQVGTTVKLARALWIVPVTLGFGFFYRGEGEGAWEKPKRPWFILGFLLAAALVTWIPSFKGPGEYIEVIARRGLVVTLFLIGLNLSRDSLKSVGFRPFLQGFLLWVFSAGASLFCILQRWISV